MSSTDSDSESSSSSSSSDSADRYDVFPNPEQLCPEILAEIFTFCLPNVSKHFIKVNHISGWKAPLLLCSVCSSWRSLAISTPRLWQTFHFRLAKRFWLTPIDTESIISGIRTWLNRSGALPLSIRVSFWIPEPELEVAIVRHLILEELLQEVSRWESFEIYDDEHCLPLPHFGILPMVHTLKSSIDGIPFTAAPCLKRLWLISLPNPTSVSAIPWDRLVELTIIQKVQPISMVVEVISCCPRLESLALAVKEGDSSPIQHDKLRKLHLDIQGTYGIENAIAIFDCLTLPVLTDLSLGGYVCNRGFQARFSRSKLIPFFTRSGCRLQKFKLHCLGLGPDELLECLRHQSCQTLTELVIQGEKRFVPMVNGALLVCLTYPEDDGDMPLCPQLHHLTLSHCYRSDESFPSLLGRMIRSRCLRRPQDDQLRSLQLETTEPLSKGDHELLQFAENNYDLELLYSYGDYSYRHTGVNNPTWLDVFTHDETFPLL